MKVPSQDYGAGVSTRPPVIVARPVSIRWIFHLLMAPATLQRSLPDSMV